MSKPPEFNHSLQTPQPNSDILPPGESILLTLGLSPDFPKSLKPGLRRSSYRAAINWLLGNFVPRPEAPNIEKVQGCLQAFHDLCTAEDWATASKIFGIQLNTPTNDYLSDQLRTWSYFSEQITLYKTLIGKVEPGGEFVCYKGLGDTYLSQGEYRHALECFEQALSLAKTIGDRQTESTVLNGQGSAYQGLGNHQRAIGCYQQALEIAREAGDRRGESGALGNLGSTYLSLGEYDQTRTHLEQHLEISREIHDKQGEGNALGSLGNLYYALRDYDRSLEYHRQYLNIARQIGNRQAECNALAGLGNGYLSSGDYDQAIACYQPSLKLSQEIGNRQGEVTVLGSLGNTCLRLGDYDQSIHYHERCLALARAIGSKHHESEALEGLGNAANFLQDYSQAITYYQQYLVLVQELGNKRDEGKAQSRLGHAYLSNESYDQAGGHLYKALEIARVVQDTEGEMASLSSLGHAVYAQRNYSQAIMYYEQYISLAESLATVESMEQVLGRLGHAYLAQNENEKAIEYLRRCLPLTHDRGTPAAEAALLANLGLAYQSSENYGEALDVFQQYATLVQDQPDLIQSDNAASIYNLARRLDELGQHSEALTAVESAIVLFQHLREASGETDPNAFVVENTLSLNAKAEILGHLGTSRDVCVEAERQVLIAAERAYHMLIEAPPSEVQLQLAVLFNNMANRLSYLELHKEGVSVAEQATHLLRIQSEASSSELRPNLAISLNTLARRLNAVGRRKEAFDAAHEAVDTLGPFFLQQPEAYGSWMVSIRKDYQAFSQPPEDVPDSVLLAPIDDALQRLEPPTHEQASHEDADNVFHQVDDRIRAALEADPVEDGYTHPAEVSLEEVVRDGGQAAGDWLIGVISSRGWNRPLAAGLLRLLSRQKPLTEAWRLRVIQLALSSPDIELRDAGVQAAESWEDPGAVEFLQKHREPCTWLADYLGRVIRDLTR